MTRLWFDWEFIEDGHTIDGLAIGIVREDGATYYAVAGLGQVGLSGLRGCASTCSPTSTAPPGRARPASPHGCGPPKPRAQIAAEILEFAGPNPEWWAYVAAYDWVALRQLYGPMVDMPAGWPYGCRDVEEIARLAGMGDGEEWMSPEHEVAAAHGLIIPEGAHHALAGALWAHELWGLAESRLRDLYGLEVSP
jgi:hypothetical protein